LSDGPHDISVGMRIRRPQRPITRNPDVWAPLTLAKCGRITLWHKRLSGERLAEMILTKASGEEFVEGELFGARGERVGQN